jgi:hypothetical protein
MTGLFEVALKNVPALQDSVNQHEMASAGMLGEEAQVESLQDNLRRMDAGSNAQASTGLGIHAQTVMGLGVHAHAALRKGNRQVVMGKRRR